RALLGAAARHHSRGLGLVVVVAAAVVGVGADRALTVGVLQLRVGVVHALGVLARPVVGVGADRALARHVLVAPGRVENGVGAHEAVDRAGRVLVLGAVLLGEVVLGGPVGPGRAAVDGLAVVVPVPLGRFG